MEAAEVPEQEELDYETSPTKRAESRNDKSIDSDDGELIEEHTAKDLSDGEEEEEGEIASDDEEEKKRGSDFEEGEITDDDEEEGELPVKARFRDDHSPPPRGAMAPPGGRRCVRREEDKTDVCKHYLKGICTWGEQCNFAHPPEDQLHLFRSSSSNRVGGASASSSNTSVTTTTTVDSNPVKKSKKGGGEESSWERALKEAKERSVNASRRKEDPDFERKRLEMAPSDEIDRRATTTATSDDSEVDEGRRRMVSPHRDSYTPPDGRDRGGERYGDRSRQRAPVIPSLLDLRPPSPRVMINATRMGGRNGGGKQRGVNFEINQELGPQCIYPNGRPKDQPLQQKGRGGVERGGGGRQRERGGEGHRMD
ncbi:hypothetical protein PFISCL1PPCAC_22280, partial [Pristionchus fissidentatus]